MNSQFVFEPDQELIDFADQVSLTFMHMKSGRLNSANNKYFLQAEYFTDSHNPARVGVETHIVEINIAALQKKEWAKSDYVFYQVLWCFCLVELHARKSGDYDNILLQCDRYTMARYFKFSGRSKKDMLHGVFEVLKSTPSQFNNNRVKLIVKLTEDINRELSGKD